MNITSSIRLALLIALCSQTLCFSNSGALSTSRIISTRGSIVILKSQFSSNSTYSLAANNILDSTLVSFDSIDSEITRGPFNYPNPFQMKTGSHIGYSLNKPIDIKLTLYNIAGRRVWTQTYPKGSDGGSSSMYNKIPITESTIGYPLPSGIYFYTLIDNDTQAMLGKGKIGVQP
jgi:hypothetical protein